MGREFYPVRSQIIALLVGVAVWKVGSGFLAIGPGRLVWVIAALSWFAAHYGAVRMLTEAHNAEKLYRATYQTSHRIHVMPPVFSRNEAESGERDQRQDVETQRYSTSLKAAEHVGAC